MAEDTGLERGGRRRRIRATRRRWALAVAAAALALLAPTGAALADHGAIATQRLAERIGSADAPVVLDVRTPEEYAQGHVPGATNVPVDALAGRLGTLGLERSSEIVVHCYAGPRARRAEAVLRDEGFAHVRELAGHWRAWRAEDRPVE